MKKPGTPKVAIKAALVSLNSERARSLFVTGFQDTGEDTISQNSFSRGDALIGLVAGDDRGIDRANRDAGDPFRLEPCVAQRLKGAGLVGAERAAALQHQHALRLRGRRCGRGDGSIHRDRRSESVECPPWPQFATASIRQMGRKITRNYVDAKMSVQNTLYLVFGA